MMIAGLLVSPVSLYALEQVKSQPDKALVASNPNDPCFVGCAPYGVPWHFGAIDALPAWERTTGSSDVTIAVVDTGIDTEHPDLLGRVTRIP